MVVERRGLELRGCMSHSRKSVKKKKKERWGEKEDKADIQRGGERGRERIIWFVGDSGIQTLRIGVSSSDGSLLPQVLDILPFLSLGSVGLRSHWHKALIHLSQPEWISVLCNLKNLHLPHLFCH